ncbi:type I DNA topoisomerase [Patescibacteria group bacterium]
MEKKLLIVESPTKAKTITKFLGKGYKVVSSFGHIRDLPQKEMGIDIKGNFDPKYVIPAKAKTTVTMLKKEAAKADEIYFATDEDREGEAIAWHLNYILTTDKKLKNKIEYHRVAFHEITKSAVEDALKSPREIDLHLVDAQQGRRILDRLVGYELSPFLWKKVAKGLSAGRVQSIAVRLIVEREEEIKAFKSEEYWSLEALLNAKKSDNKIVSNLSKINDKKVDKLDIKKEKQVKAIVKDLDKAKYIVDKLEQKKTKRQPPAPFTTSTLQQEANHKLRFSAKQTMFMAQSLYEGVELGDKTATGLITYMRTDSVNLADKFLDETQSFVKSEFGKEYFLDTPRKFKSKSKNAQEAHEAIRPTDINRRPEDLKSFLKDNQYKLYELIWKRTLASQMKEAQMNAVALHILANGKKDKYIFRANGSSIHFAGWLKLYPNNVKENFLPELSLKEELNLEKLDPQQHFTEPPARFSEATLVKKLEELGIGRPSTYAPTISTIEDRGYIRKEERRLIPQDIAFIVNKLLVEHFPKIVDYDFTAKLEDDLDKVAEGKSKWKPLIKDFYMPFKDNLTQKTKEIKKADLINEESDEVCEKCNEPMIIKTGRYGKFLACSGFPKCRNIKPLKKVDTDGDGVADSVEEKKEPEVSDQKCEKCGEVMLIRDGKFGKFLACSGFPKCKNTKPIDAGTGVKCAECGEGEMVARRTRSRRTFYACNRYPECKFAVWSPPVVDPDSKDRQGMKCPKCKSLVVEGPKDTIKCSKKECEWSKEKE